MFATGIIIANTVLETPHVIVGAAIATHVVNPALALPLALGSHFILDRVPHWNPHLNRELNKHGKVTVKSTKLIIIDSSCALLFGLFIAHQALPNIAYALTILAACFLSVLPDVVGAPYYFLNAKNKILKKWVHFQKSMQSDAPLVYGLITQLLVIFAALYWIFA